MAQRISAGELMDQRQPVPHRIGVHRAGARSGVRAGNRHPEIGGMTSRELVAVLRAMAPADDQAEITAAAGANLAYELISLMVA
jgi:hypothetical protein